MSYVVIRQPEGVSTITVQMGGAGEGSATSAVETVNNIDPVSGNVTLTAADVGAVATGDLAPVATSGDYDDLTGKPTIPSTPGDIGAATAAQGALADSAVQAGDLAPVATSGAYTDLTGKPTIPTTPGEVGADAAGAAAVVASDLSDHEVLTTGAHGGIVAEGDPRLTDDRDPTPHGSSHDWNGTDPVAVPARPVVYYDESDVVLRDWGGSGPQRVLNIPSPAPVTYVPADPTVDAITAIAVSHDPSDPDYRFTWSVVLPAPAAGVSGFYIIDDGPGASASSYGVGYTYALDPLSGYPPIAGAVLAPVDGIDFGAGGQWAWAQPDFTTAILGSWLDDLTGTVESIPELTEGAGISLTTTGSGDTATTEVATAGPIIEDFFTTGTYTPVPGAKAIRVQLWSGGGGGGGGRCNVTSTLRGGGGGGQSGCYTEALIPASLVAAPVTVTIGAGGAGGTASVTAVADGGNGGNGGNTTFGSLFKASGGGGGNGGTNAGGGAAGGGLFATTKVATKVGQNGGNGAGTAAAPVLFFFGIANQSGTVADTGAGGGGASLTTGNARMEGAQGSSAPSGVNGLSPSTYTNNAAGGNGHDLSLLGCGGGGGAGGGVDTATFRGFPGGNGGTGGGGGGGGAGTLKDSGGVQPVGGAGGIGWARITTWL